MENQNYQYDNIIEVEDLSVSASRKFLAGVFSWMFVAMVVSGVVAYLVVANIQTVATVIFNPTTQSLNGIGLVLIFAPLAFALTMQWGYQRIAYPVLAALFITYASLIGISLGLITLAYTATSVVSVFIAAASIFGVMAIAGYTTQVDLTQFGSILRIAFIGLFVGFLINFFVGSSQADYIMSIIGAAIFTGLTAYYMQMLKRIGAGLVYGSVEQKKLALIGGLVLYITLVNLFMMLLRIFGRRR